MFVTVEWQIFLNAPNRKKFWLTFPFLSAGKKYNNCSSPDEYLLSTTTLQQSLH